MQEQQQLIAVPDDVSRVELLGHVNALMAQRNQAANEAASLAGKLHQANVYMKALTEQIAALQAELEKARKAQAE